MKLTKADIDKVRHIEGFPIARDEDIIALSRPPYYTACPNPFIEDFIRENGTPYDEATDDYHREPFAADVSEGKHDPLYMAHSYHTKVPYMAIMRYILHYTKPGDIVLDGFCGTGMTGVAAQMCGNPNNDFKAKIENDMRDVHWGARKAILSDLSPAATFIAYNYCAPINLLQFREEAERIIRLCESDCQWMYETRAVDENNNPIIGISGKPLMGRINYTVWSDVYICPSCTKEIVYWDAAVHQQEGVVDDPFICPYCHSKLKRNDCERAFTTEFDDLLGTSTEIAKSVPVMISYTVGKKRCQKHPDSYDLDVIQRVNSYEFKTWIPTNRMMEGNEARRNDATGNQYVHQFYTRRNGLVMSTFWQYANECTDERLSLYLRFLMTSVFSRSHKLNRYMPNHFRHVGPLSGTLYMPFLQAEISILDLLKDKLASVIQAGSQAGQSTIVSCGSTTDLSNIPNNSCDYIFTDPPFGDNLSYSELNFLMESWLKVTTCSSDEAVINLSHGKALPEYQEAMTKCFEEYYRVLKPGRWITVEFHNSKNAVWNAINEALSRSGFIVANIDTIDKQKGTTKQLTYSSAVKQDLIISAYKPREAFVREFQTHAGDPEMVWAFVRQHLRNVPITADVNRDGKLDIISERQRFLLFDRMVAWHIMNGIPVPMDAQTFYEGLRQRFLERDGMFFLPDQVTEYDDKRAHMELDVQQMSFLVTDEKNAIAWLNYILAQGPKTYQEIQPLYLQELHQSKQEKMPELLDMLRENFVQDEKGAWYIPDLNNAADLAKVRRKALLKEFYDSCVPGKGKLKVFRMEAIRAGFDECWKQRDFATIVSVGERLPEAALQEDQTLLMYYDNACSRV